MILCVRPTSHDTVRAGILRVTERHREPIPIYPRMLQLEQLWEQIDLYTYARSSSPL